MPFCFCALFEPCIFHFAARTCTPKSTHFKKQLLLAAWAGNSLLDHPCLYWLFLLCLCVLVCARFLPHLPTYLCLLGDYSGCQMDMYGLPSPPPPPPPPAHRNILTLHFCSWLAAGMALFARMRCACCGALQHGMLFALFGGAWRRGKIVICAANVVNNTPRLYLCCRASLSKTPPHHVVLLYLYIA